MIELSTARHRARLAKGPQDLNRARALRQRAFRGGPGLDADRFDAGSQHVLIETAAGKAVATFRFRVFPPGADLADSYAAQFYDLTSFAALDGPKAEVGRLCLHPRSSDPQVLRLTWAALTRLCLGHRVMHLFGCTSFAGADPARHAAALGWLHHHARGPNALRPLPKGGAGLALCGPQASSQDVPPLLRFYLGLGAWVADHAMIDPDLDTLHLFTALHLADVPRSRARILRSIAGYGQKSPKLLAESLL